MPGSRPDRKYYLFLITVISPLIISSSLDSNHIYFDSPKVVFGQTDLLQTNSDTTSSVNMQDVPNKSLNNESISQEELKSLVTASLGSGWTKLHHESADIPANFTFQQMMPSLPLETLDNQMKVGFAWETTNWKGNCEDLAKIAKPTLVNGGTDDNL